VEEVGELLGAEYDENPCDITKAADAVGDTIIYIAHYCGMNGYELKGLLDDSKYSILFFGLQKTLQHLPLVVGRLCHAHLKLEQKIRSNEDHRQNAREALAGVVGLLKCYCLNRNINFENAVRETWSNVAQRDWKSNPVNGVAAAKQILKPIKNIQKKSLPTKTKRWKIAR